MKRLVIVAIAALIALLTIGLSACGGGEATSYCVRFYDEDGTTQIGITQTVDKGGELVVPTDPEKNGYTFKGWTVEGQTDVVDFSMSGAKKVSGNVTYIAKYEMQKFKVKFYKEDGITLYEAKNIDYNAALEFPTVDPEETDYLFKGWQKKTDNEWEPAVYDNTGKTVTSDMEFRAAFGVGYKITYLKPDGTEIENGIFAIDSSIEFPTTYEGIAPDQYVCGWMLDGNGEVITQAVCTGEASYTAVCKEMVYLIKNGVGNVSATVAFETVDETAVADVTLTRKNGFTAEKDYVVLFDRSTVDTGSNKWFVFDLYIPDSYVAIDFGNYCIGKTANHSNHYSKWHNQKEGGLFVGKTYKADITVPWYIANSDGTYDNFATNTLSVRWNRIAVDISELNKLGVRLGDMNALTTSTVKIANLALATDETLAKTVKAKTFAFGNDYRRMSLEKKAGSDFKILQLTDIHLQWFGPNQEAAFSQIRKLVEKTKPDWIILTGDNVFGQYDTDGAQFKALVTLMDSFKTPWSFVNGNHDGETSPAGMGLAWQANYVKNNAQYCLFESGDAELGVGNYVVNLKKDNSVFYSFVMMDTHGAGVGVGITQKQIEWYANEITQATESRYGENSAQKVPSLLFLHIPLPEFQLAMTAHSGNADGIGKISDKGKTDEFGNYGENKEKCCVFSGSSFWNRIKSMGSTVGIFAGHDHINNSSIIYEGIRLTYGLKTGPSCYFDLQGGTLITIDDSAKFSVSPVYASDI